MKRPVTSLCRRPGKKTACGAVCPRCGNNFRPQGRSAAGRRNCRAKATRTTAQKQPPAKPGAVRRLRPWGSGRRWGYLVPGSITLGARRGRGYAWAQKQPPAEAGSCAQTAPWGNSRQWGCLVPGRRHTGCSVGQRAYPAQKQPPAEAGDCAQVAPMGERQAMGVSGTGKHHTGHPPGQRAYPGAKTAPGGAGGCLDAGYGCYLPRAIRVIWMHRVGSTARPRIMPS